MRLRVMGVIVLMMVNMELAAQSPISFEHLTLRHGLSQSVPNDIHQDSDGFLWIGTQDGLNRYDGYSFRIFKNSSDDSTTVSHSWIWKVCEDDQRNLWVATWNGLNRYDRKNNHFIRYNKSVHGSVANTRTNIVFKDSGGQLWAGTWGNGLHRYDPRQDRFEQVAVPQDAGRPAGFIRSIYEDRDQRLWVATFGAGLFLFDSDLGELVQSGPPQTTDERITAITQDKDGNIWLGTNEKGILIWHPDRGVVDHVMRPRLNDDQVTHLLTDHEGNIWVGTREGGINLYRDNEFTFWDHHASDEQSIAGSNIYSLFQDRSGIVWVGSNALSKYDKRRKKFIHITHQHNIPTTLSNRVVRCIYEDSQSRIWVATQGGGLNLLDKDYRVVRIFRHNPNDPGSIGSNDVRGIVEHEDGTFWVATHRSGLNRLDLATGKFSRYASRKDYPVGAVDIQHIMLDSQGMLWIGTVRTGIVCYDTRKDSFTIPQLVPADTVPISSVYVNRIDRDESGRLWISGWGGGLSVLNPASDTLIRYLHAGTRSQSLANDIVYCVHRDRKGRQWVGTAGGLNLLIREKSRAYNSSDETFKLYTERDGLSNNVVYGILEDETGKLWLSTNYGLSCFDPEREEFRNYYEDDGLQSDEFNASAFLRCADGRLIFGGINGINIFRPEELYMNTNIPPVAITAMNIFEKPLNDFQSAPIHLQYNQNFISFEFAALDFMAPQRNTFAYRLEGLEENWVMAGQRRYASYTDLKPGTYTFRVKASNNDGIWNEEGASITFTIDAPFWMTWWFILLIIFVMAFTLYRVYRYRVNQKLQLERLRTKIASDLHDEIGSSLTRISIYSELLSNGVAEPEKRSYLSNIRDISREVVGTMSDIVWSIDSRSDTLDDLVLRMKDFSMQLLSSRQIEFEFSTRGMEEKKILSPQLKQGIYLVFKEALHNIVKHANARRVRIQMEHSSVGFNLRITDDGKGFETGIVSRGNGLRSMQRRAEEMGARFRILNDQGTTIVLERESLVG